MTHDDFFATDNPNKATNADENLGSFLSQTQLSRTVQPHLQMLDLLYNLLGRGQGIGRLMESNARNPCG
ncbi:hypothetical protein [Coleofasciculus sp. FACHB-1120]|uniref:hypothetical protein n=1 Tax=Coleofasciculus sp. FACHB-1120 TaxID=2692783 RepID=UPI0016880295|nr:hypothetical protein [Coleofasciculus sp. FACHB-1120]MBD2744368.1 hypothetical protein [Coleofasciculus sp. FACHB-1120]